MRTCLLVIAGAIACTPPPHHAERAPQALGYPRIATYFIETPVHAGPRDVIAKSDLAIIDAENVALDRAPLDAIRRARPDGYLLAYLTSEEIARDPTVEQPLAAARFARIRPSEWLVEAGSALVEAAGASQTRLRVRDPAAFAVHPPHSDFYGPDEPTYLLVDGEHMKLVAIEGDELVVDRGYRSKPIAHAAGARVAAHVVFFGGTWMLDLAANAPADTGRTWRDELTDEFVGLLRQGPWNGVVLDDCFEDISWIDPGKLDLDRDGIADPRETVSAQWSAGFELLVQQLRTALGPDVPIVANPGAQDCPHRGLDGILLEGWPTGMPAKYLAFSAGLERYLDWSRRDHHLTVANGYSPRIGFGMIKAGQDELARTDYQAMRFGLATTLMGDGLFTFDNGVFGHYVAWWYDEYDGAGAGLHWLGRALGPERIRGDVRWREFEHGLAVVNLGAAPASFAAPRGFARLRGRQDPVHNDGRRVDGALAIAPRDAYLLRRL